MILRIKESNDVSIGNKDILKQIHGSLSRVTLKIADIENIDFFRISSNAAAELQAEQWRTSSLGNDNNVNPYDANSA